MKYDLVVIDMDATARVARVSSKELAYWKQFFSSHQGVWIVKAFKVKDYFVRPEIPPASHYITKTTLAKIWLDIQYERVDCFYYSEFVKFFGDAHTAFKTFNAWKRSNPKALITVDADNSDRIPFGNK